MKTSHQVIHAGNLRLSIPRRTARLLFVSDEDPKHAHRGPGVLISAAVDASDDLTEFSVRIDCSPQTEPSTIYTSLPVRRPAQPHAIKRPPYYPTYAEMTPQQRWIYLDWLTDVTQEINLGYVFVYYYGLERHLLYGNFDIAFDETLMLRHHYRHSSFPYYCTSALIASCAHRKRPDRLSEIPREGNHLLKLTYNKLILFHRMKPNLTADDLLAMAGSIKDVNKRYLRNELDLYRATMDEVLTELYGVPHFPFAGRYDVEGVPTRETIQFANFSLPKELRYVEIPDYFNYQPFVQAAQDVFVQTHERVKMKLAERRKQRRRKPSTPGT